MAETPHAVKIAPNAAKLRMACVASAKEAIGKLEPGFRLVGLTKGQFSMLDLVRAVLQQTGPAKLRITTWTMGIRDAETAGYLLQQGQITGLQLLTDRSFPGRQPGYCDRVRQLFGEDAIRVTNIHAKIALIENDAWSVCIRGSMNLTRNPRFEQFDIDDDRAICGHFGKLFDELMEAAPPGWNNDNMAVNGVFARALERVDNGETFGGEERITRAELARRCGVAPNAITRAVEAGRIVRGDDGKYSADSAKDAFFATSKLSPLSGDGAKRGPGQPTKAVTEEQQSRIDRYEEAKTKKMEADARKAQTAADEAAGLLVDRAEAARTVFDAFRILRDRIQGLPARRAAWLATEDDAHAIQNKLRADIESALQAVTGDVLARMGEE